jgi:predicted PurR-regulated permease PerM
VPAAGTPGLSGLMTLAVSAVVLAALYVGRDVFLPVVLALLLAFVIAPFVDLLRRWHVGRVPAVIAAVLVALTIVLSLTGIIGLQLAGLVSDLPRYEASVQSKISALNNGFLGRIPAHLKNVGRGIEEATKDAPAAPASAPPAEPKPLPVEVHDREATSIELARSVLAPLVEPLAMMGIVFVVLIFVLLQREDLRDRMIRLFGSSDLHRTTVAMDDAARRLSRYFLIQLGLNASFGVLIAAGLWMIGVPSPLLCGIFAALMRFVPYIGSFIAAALPAILAAAVEPGWSMALMTVALFLIAEPLMGNVIEPVVYGQSTGLSPFAVVLSAIFWTWLWGPVGLLIATPLTLCLVVLGRHVERFEFLDVLLGDRPALTPAENLYQRMLAGDPDEALEYAEQLLKERSLTSYYDEVALGGLQLAANDANRGVLSGDQLVRIRDAVQALVHDLSIHEDVTPAGNGKENEPVALPADERPGSAAPAVPPDRPAEEEIPPDWRVEGAVLCVAGRGQFDDAAAEMLSQLLRKHELGVRTLPHAAVSRSAILELDPAGVKMICIAYLRISGSPAHLRYLLKRLRRRVPGAPILIGLWPAEDAILTDETLRAAIGADHCVASLREAVIRCLAEATGMPAESLAAPAAPSAVADAEEPVERAPLPA